MAASMPEPTYTCEICGLEGLNEESMRDHTIHCHLEGAASCPFCDFSELSPNELLIHVNTAHLDYLTPEDEYFDDWRFGESSGPFNLNDFAEQNINLNNNFNNNYINNNNNNNSVLTSSGAGAEGSPLRMELNLNLRENNIPTPVKTQPRQHCMMCRFASDSPLELEEHINRQHFDLTSPLGNSSTQYNSAGRYRCPLCDLYFKKVGDVEFHVNMEHRDILSPVRCAPPLANPLSPGNPDKPDNWIEGCPVCGRLDFQSNQEMTAHIDDHFDNGTPATPEQCSDRTLAREIDRRERETRRQREQREFALLQAQYGMDNQGNFREQSLTNMQKAVYAGEMSVSDYFQRQIELKEAEHTGIDDGRSSTKDLMPKIRAISLLTPNVVRTLTCTTVDHYGSTYGDRGWGCGYRNIQMLLSSLLYHTGYNEELNKPRFVEGRMYKLINGLYSRTSMPSVSKLQEHIEWAWKQGFDTQGCEQFGNELQNSRKWIGATEVVTALSSLRIRCQLIDFYRPTSPDGSHPDLFNWVLEYFQMNEDFIPPLYLQHQGHSRTIVGIEQYRDGHLALLVFDPSHTMEQLNQLKSTATAENGMRIIRKTLSAIKARQYQIVAVCGIMETDQEYEESKEFVSTRIPPDA